MKLLDGKAVADGVLDGIKTELAKFPKKLSLAVVLVGGDPASKKFVEQKKKVADGLGISFRVYDYPAAISTNELRKRIAVIVHEADPTGIIIQLPLPAAINAQYILNSIPPGKDVDVLSARAVGDFSVGKSALLPPVAGAVKMLFEHYEIPYRDKHVLIVGAGTLVGKPIAAWLLREKVSFSVADVETRNLSEFTKKADIIISGVGKPGLITGVMIQEGAVVIDAGTSEAGGKLLGDADFGSVSEKASFMTPVPGGVGPLTVAMIFQNLLLLAKKHA